MSATYRTNYMIIDGSYYLFSIFFISKNDYLKKYPDWEQPDLYDWSTNTEFWNIYQIRFKSHLIKLIRKLHIYKNNIYFVREGKKSLIWRNNIYPEYKTNRTHIIHHKGKDNILGDLFPRVYYELLPQYVENNHLKVIRVLSAEADDVIFLLTRYLESIRRTRIFIISKDKDFIQLVSNVVSIHTIYLDNIMDNIPLTPTQYLQTKLLLGDLSDNIPACIQSHDYNHMSLLNNVLFEELYNSHKINLNQLHMNYRLILYTHIPFHIKMLIHNQIIALHN